MEAGSAENDTPVVRPVRSHAEYRRALAVRVAVFVEEQKGPAAEEPDAWDDSARHFVLLLGDEIVGTGRLYRPAVGIGKLGRIALLPAYRGRGWGVRLVRELLDHARALGLRVVILDAQTHAVEFYRRLGFRAEGEEFLEAGIPHRRMRLGLREQTDAAER